MAIPWRLCWRWTTGATSTRVLETICGFNGRSATFAASSLRGTGAVACSGYEVDIVRACQCQYFAGRACCQPKEGQPGLSSRPVHTTSKGNYILTRHKSRLLYPTPKPCCCKRIHSDAKLKDPFTLAQKDLNHLYDDIKKELFVSKSELKSLCDYYFDGKGKAFRPMIVVLMARACNIHSNRDGDLLPGQRSIAMISEMIHTASLVHDDVIDGSDKRRGKTTINEVWGERKAILAGDFILSAASMALARIGNNTVVSVLSQVIEDLVRGEFMQLGSKENENERFKHYLEKNFKKTASLIANSCKAVSILVNSDPEVHEIAFQYGRNVGIAFQLVDDVLDFTACASQLGKPSATDLKLGLATGPVLFACQQFPELHAMIMRRFSTSGDVDRAWQYVLESDGVDQTNYLAQRYCQEAIRQISLLRPSPERDALIRLTEMVLTRDK
ncbi:all trans-polyprenyl-diphosphate synthase PDSS1 isoform X2 [Coregonus clupeaformis]|uniref:all trans-polyprenyl-diphosphate synthase PDSS1 isoform X2 n=1 Tax=Coregonus clupeaformis TaxID=59861 RepID=UPI001BE10E03|nr:all trans-polyprenyl-diphosphate synthase PDSS1 isoform X2 [Coregonus clupeaformis]